MYEAHWKLESRPFENRLESDYYYPAETHQAAMLKLHYAIENRKACAALCGPGGMGKTLIAESISTQLGDTFRPVSQIVFPAMNSEQFLRFMVGQLDSSGEPRSRESSEDLQRFQQFIGRNVEAGQHAVIVVDEAHLLEQHGLLEPLRLLLNVGAASSSGESAWTLVLVGQPTLLSHIERYHALDERMAVKCMLNRFLPEETTAYVQHRLRIAGADAESIFDYQALERIHALTEGIPRRINRLCDLALMVGYAEDRERISGEVIDSVHGDLAAPTLV